ncbi:MAG: IS21 family transposase [Duodenibacillus sp.]|nr:IS21 family transposase [Duodenibacillus sp.]
MKRDLSTVVEVLAAASLNQSTGKIAKNTGVPKTTVRRILSQAKAAGVDLPAISSLTEQQLESIFMPKRRVLLNYVEPDWEDVYVKHEQPKHGQILRTIWEDYKAAVGTSGKPMGYSAFCRGYAAFKQTLPASLKDVSMTFQWDPGDTAMIDFSGDTLPYVTSDGKEHEAEIFVGVMAYSNFIFCMATADLTRNSWLLACKAMLEYFGAVPKYVFLDNGSLVTQPDTTDPKACDEFRSMAAYYGFCPFPVRPLQPTDKGMVEGAVKIIQQEILNPLRDCQFLSLEDVNQSIAPKLEKLNNRPLSERLVSRRKLMLEDEIPVMQSLPVHPYELDMVEKLLKVSKSYQVRLNNRRFSVPYTYAGKFVKVLLSKQSNLLRVFDAKTGKQITQHHYDENGKLQNILIEHMPPNHQAVLMTKDDLLKSLHAIGPNIGELGRRLTHNQPTRVARKFLSSMLYTARSMGTETIEKIARGMLKLNAPTFAIFRQEVDMWSEGRRKRAGGHAGQERTADARQPLDNVRGAEYYRELLALQKSGRKS